MLTSLACFIVALALAPSLFVQVTSVPLAPITIEPYPSPRQPVGALRENTNHDTFDVILFEAEAPPTADSEGNIPKYKYTDLQAFANIYLCCAR
jgi:hypothetical protein